MNGSTTTAALACLLALGPGCSAGNPADGTDVPTATTHHAEIVVVNDHSRYLASGADTERDTGDIVNLAARLFADSTALASNKLQVLLVGQKTLQTAEEDLPHVAGAGGTVSYRNLLLVFAAWRQAHPLPPPSGPNDAAILLTSLEDVEGATVLAATGQMCAPLGAVAVVNTRASLALNGSSVARAIGALVGMCADPPDTRSDPGYRCPPLPGGLVRGSTCTDRIMSASPDPAAPPTSFSACSASDFDEWIATRVPLPSCLAIPVP